MTNASGFTKRHQRYPARGLCHLLQLDDLAVFLNERLLQLIDLQRGQQCGLSTSSGATNGMSVEYKRGDNTAVNGAQLPASSALSL